MPFIMVLNISLLVIQNSVMPLLAEHFEKTDTLILVNYYNKRYSNIRLLLYLKSEG